MCLYFKNGVFIGIYGILNYVIGKYLISITSVHFMMGSDVPLMFFVLMGTVPLTCILFDTIQLLIS